MNKALKHFPFHIYLGLFSPHIHGVKLLTFVSKYVVFTYKNENALVKIRKESYWVNIMSVNF